MKSEEKETKLNATERAQTKGTNEEPAGNASVKTAEKPGAKESANKPNVKTAEKNGTKETASNTGVKTAEKPGAKESANKPTMKTAEKPGTKDTQDQAGMETGEKPKKKKKRIGWIFALLLVGVLLLGYFGTAYYFTEHFYPHTVINGLDCSGLTEAEAAQQLEEQGAKTYCLSLLGKDGTELLALRAGDVSMVFHADESLYDLLAAQNAYTWIAEILSGKERSVEISVTGKFDSGAAEAFLDAAGLFEGADVQVSADAYISEYLEDKKCYEIIPEQEGDLLNRKATVEMVDTALTNMIAQVDLKAERCYEQPDVTSEDAALQAKLAEMNKLVGSCITYDWNGEEVIVDGDLIHQWLIIDGDSVMLDEEQVEDFVTANAKANDTYGKKRKFTTSLGEELTLPSGAYGWKTDRKAETAALMELILNGTVTDREPEYSCKGWVKGKNDIGNSYVEADLTNQHLYLYQNGEIVLETDFVSGNMARGNATPAGVFGLTYKTRDAVLRGRDYETPVQYWMPFNGNVGMHDASWRKSFGGDIYLNSGSHGCINLPTAMAAEIYEYVSKGFPVICYYY